MLFKFSIVFFKMHCIKYIAIITNSMLIILPMQTYLISQLNDFFTVLLLQRKPQNYASD
jgi:hypothetical protein